MIKIAKYFVICLLLSSCATKMRPIIQIDGQPVSDSMVTAHVLGLKLKLKYQLTKRYEIQEGDEKYWTTEYISFLEPLDELKESEYLTLDLIIFNPTMNDFKLVQHVLSTKGGETPKTLYEGNLSRHNISVKLPVAKRFPITYYFELLGKKDLLQYRSFKVMYQLKPLRSGE